MVTVSQLVQCSLLAVLLRLCPSNSTLTMFMDSVNPLSSYYAPYKLELARNEFTMSIVGLDEPSWLAVWIPTSMPPMWTKWIVLRPDTMDSGVVVVPDDQSCQFIKENERGDRPAQQVVYLMYLSWLRG